MTFNQQVLFFLLFISTWAHAIPPNKPTSYWQCVTQDKTDKQWSAKNTFQKVALNLAFSTCKKESMAPLTCKTSKSRCEGFNQGERMKSGWVCTALDDFAQAWPSVVYSSREEAALGAKGFCKHNSAVPETCYINLITCANAT